MSNDQVKKYPLKMIVAVAKNGVIGNGDKIPWRISEEFKHFKQTTMGGIVVFGRRTWDSIGRALPGRENAVITSNPQAVLSKIGILPERTAVRAFSSLQELMQFYASDSRDVWICGGANLYLQALPFTSEILVSRINMNPEGDIFFPSIPREFSDVTIISESELFDVVNYARK